MTLVLQLTSFRYIKQPSLTQIFCAANQSPTSTHRLLFLSQALWTCVPSSETDLAEPLISPPA